MKWQTINMHFEETICFIQFNRPDANNTINALLVEECFEILNICDNKCNIVVLEGLPGVFCYGADFHDMHLKMVNGNTGINDPEKLYNLWLKLATGPYITVSHVRGKAIAGGLGFVAASDIVIADETAQFGLSELLFGLFPAMVLPFLIRKIGFQKAHYLTLTTKPISVQQAATWGLIDAYFNKSDVLLRQHIMRLKNITKTGISQYKNFMNNLNDILLKSKELAVSANRNIFSDTQNLEKIFQFVEKGKFPWEI